MSHSEKDLRADLVRLAYENPDIRDTIIPLVTNNNLGGVDIDDIQAEKILTAMFGGEQGDKVAFNEKTARFVAWVVDRNKKYDANKTEKIIEQLSGKAPLQPKPKGSGGSARGPIKTGEMVKFDKYKCAEELNQDICDKFNHSDHEEYGVVTKVESDGCLVQIHKSSGSKIGSPVRIEGTKTGKSTGMYRHTPMARIGSSGSDRSGLVLECVYLRGGSKPPSMSDQQSFAQYIKRGISAGEEREAIYYTGRLTRFAISQKNELYFQISSDQRSRPTSINPTKGTLLYVGQMNKRPGGWDSALKDEVKVLLSNDPPEEKDDK